MRIEKTIDSNKIPVNIFEKEFGDENANDSFVRVYFKGHYDHYPETIDWLLQNGACLEDKSVLILISW